LVQDVLHVDQNHRVFGAELRHGLKNHLWQANLHVCVENSVLLGDVLQKAQDALLALNY
jgi:hypothetical protein